MDDQDRQLQHLVSGLNQTTTPFGVQYTLDRRGPDRYILHRHSRNTGDHQVTRHMSGKRMERYILKRRGGQRCE